MNTVLIAARVALAGIFLLAAATKLLDMQGFRSALEGFGLPQRLAAPAAVSLPLAEVLVVALVIPAATATAGAAIAAGLLLVFVAGIVAALRRGDTPDCHCFGQLHSRPVGAETLVRNGVFMAIAVFVLVAGPGPGFGSWWRSSGGSIIALAAVGLLVCIGTYVVVTLRQTNRRLEGRTRGRSSEPKIRIGQVAPGFQATDTTGSVVRAESVFGRNHPEVLVFTSATCGPCHALLPELARWREMLVGRLGIHILAAGEEAENRRLATEHKVPILLDTDGEIAEAYGIAATPTAVQIDPDGRVGASPAPGVTAIEWLIRATLKPAQLSDRDRERFLKGSGGDLPLSVRDRERLLHAIYKPVAEIERPVASPWAQSRAYRSVKERLIRLWFEREPLTEGQSVELEHLTPDLVHYEPTSWLPLRWALRQLRPGPEDVFVDFGCGKGRVICEAAKRPFARVVGVEISPRLLEAAQANVERSRESFKCQNIELITSDAADWRVPDDMTVAYLYHPFTGDVFQRVIDNIVRSLARCPRKVRLVYVGPVLEKEILDTGLFQLVAKRRGHVANERIFNTVALFEHDPAARPPALSVGEALGVR